MTPIESSEQIWEMLWEMPSTINRKGRIIRYKSIADDRPNVHPYFSFNNRDFLRFTIHCWTDEEVVETVDEFMSTLDIAIKDAYGSSFL